MREELRRMRKETQKPVSRMKKADISAEIERMKVRREETPAVASTVASIPKKMNPSVETVKEAKAAEFPVAPAVAKSKPAPKSAAKSAAKAEVKVEKSEEAPKKKESKLKRLMAMMKALDED